MKRALAVVVLAVLWVPVKVLTIVDDLVVRYSPDDLDREPLAPGWVDGWPDSDPWIGDR